MAISQRERTTMGLASQGLFVPNISLSVCERDSM